MIAGKRLALQDDLVPTIGVRAVKCRHEQMEIGRQRLHNGHFRLVRTDYGRHHLGSPIIYIEPCGQRRVLEGLEVALDTLRRPRRKVLLDAGRRPLRLHPEGVSA